MSSDRPPARRPARTGSHSRPAARQVRRPVVGIPRAAVVVPGTVHRPQVKAPTPDKSEKSDKPLTKQSARDSVARAVAEGPAHPAVKAVDIAAKASHGHPRPVAGADKARKPHPKKRPVRGLKRPSLRRKRSHTSDARVFNRKNMFRLRHGVQLGLILGCLGWGIYQIMHTTLVPSEEPNSVAATVAQDGQTLDDTYPGLPTEVAAVVRSVVATQRIVGGATGPVQNGFAGSGVVINDEQILTAGHNVEDGKGLACSQTQVLAAGMLSRASASQEVVTYASVEYGQDEDIAVLQVKPSANFKDLPDVRLAGGLPQAGETVYFINYQPAADGGARTPFAKDAAYAEPAIFSATVLGTADSHFAVATGGGKSFGKGLSDVLLRKGASGGAVVNGDGELVGLSVASESLAANRSAASILREYQVNLPPQNYQVAYMQQVDSGLVNRLRTGMVSCGGNG